MEPHMEAAVASVVRRMVLHGLQQHPASDAVSPEIQAAAVSWAICGAASEWMRSPNRAPSEQIAEAVVRLVAPILQVTAHA